MGTSQLSFFEDDLAQNEVIVAPPDAKDAAVPLTRRSEGERSPAFWIEEIRLLRSLSPKPRQELRRITFRRGVNIVWAPPLETDDPEARFSGHAAGKTSLCRLIRYLLGELKCGGPFLNERLRAQLPRGWAVARIWIDDQPWIVARPFTGRKRSLCAQTSDLDGWLVSDPAATADDFERFRVTLHQAVLEPLAVKTYGGSGESIRFLHLLGWLSRDQECRLNGLLAWRHSESQSASPTISHQDRQFLVRIVLGLMDPEIQREMEHRVGLEEDLRKLPAEIGFRRRTVEEAIEALRPFIDDTHPNLADPLFISGAERRLDSEERRQLAEGRPTGALTVDEQRIALDHALEELGAAKIAVASWEKDPCGVEAALANRYCPFHVDTPDPFPKKGGLVRKNRLPAVKAELARARERAEARRRDHEEALREDEVRRHHEEEIRNHYRVIREHLQRAMVAQTTLEALLDMRQNLQSEIAASLERQDALQPRLQGEANRFHVFYKQTMRSLLGRDTEASCKFTRETIKLEASCNGDLNSAAINTLITLGFDIAALRFAAFGHGHHPRFLVHDSPREADMDAHLYRRLFHCAELLEPENGDADFQYIITSTEAPPAGLRKEPWLRLRLDASKGKERLFAMDL